MATEFEKLASSYSDLRGTIVNPEGWDQMFDFYSFSDETYAAYPRFWTPDGIRLLGMIPTEGAIFKSDMDPDLASLYTLWDKLADLSPTADHTRPLVRTLFRNIDETQVHIDLNVGDIQLTNPRVRGNSAHYVFYPPSSDKQESWDMLGPARQWIVGPGLHNPVTLQITPESQFTLRGGVVTATDAVRHTSSPSNIPHGVITSGATKRDLITSHA